MSQVHCSSIRSPIKFCISPAVKELSAFYMIEQKLEKKYWVVVVGICCMSCNLLFYNSIYKGLQIVLLQEHLKGIKMFSSSKLKSYVIDLKRKWSFISDNYVLPGSCSAR
jgi:hypothetical protein